MVLWLRDRPKWRDINSNPQMKLQSEHFAPAIGVLEPYLETKKNAQAGGMECTLQRSQARQLPKLSLAELPLSLGLGLASTRPGPGKVIGPFQIHKSQRLTETLFSLFASAAFYSQGCLLQQLARGATGGSPALPYLKQDRLQLSPSFLQISARLMLPTRRANKSECGLFLHFKRSFSLQVCLSRPTQAASRVALLKS